MTKAEQAVVATIRRMMNDPRVAYLIGPGSGTFDKLIDAYAEINGKTVKQAEAEIEPLLKYEPWPCND